MPSKFVEYPLKNGYVHNWLVAGPQTIPVDLARFTGPDVKGQIAQRYYKAESGIKTTPIERGPLDKGLFRVGQYTGSWSYYACPEDHFVDQSGHYPTCQYLRSWAYIEAVSDRPQTVTFALTTYGPADVWLAHTHVHRTEVYGAQPTTLTFEAPLRQGATAILVRFEGIGARDTAHAMALRLCQPGDAAGTLAPVEGVHVRFRTLMPKVERRNAFEQLSAAVYMERDVYEGETPIIMRWPDSPRAFCPAYVRFQTPDNWIYAEGETSGAPGATSQLGYAIYLPTSAFRATLMPSPDEVYLEHMRIFHHVPLWSMGRQRYVGYPEGNLAERRTAALQAATTMEGSPFAQMARMALGAWADVDTKILLGAMDAVNQRAAGSNLILLGLLGMLYRWGDHPDFPADLRPPLEACILGYRYWVDDTGHDVMDFATESSRLLFHACEILAGQRYPAATFADQHTGEWHRARGERLAQAWLATFGAYGSAAWNASGAIEHTAAALAHLCDLSTGEQVYEMAAICLDKLLLMLAINSSRGALGAAGQCTPASVVKSGLLQPTAGISHLMWGMGIYNHHIAGVVSLACAASYELPPVIDIISIDAPPEVISREQHAVPGEPPANLMTCKTPDFMLSSVQDYRPGQPGQQEQVWRASLGAAAVVFANHPGSSSEADSRAPGFWAGNACLPRVAQWRDSLVALHRLPPEDRMGFTHAYFPTAMFDAYSLRDGWAFARVGDGYLALTNSQGFTLPTEGRYALRELRALGDEQTWLVQMGRAELDGDFDAFQAAVLALPVTFADGGVRYTTLRGDTISLDWTGEFMVNTVAQPLVDFPHLENRYTATELPCRQMEVYLGEDGLRLDFTPPS